jgi:hypothetical protein
MPRKQLPYGNTDGALTLDQVIGSLLDEEVVIEADTLSDLQNGPEPTAGRVAEVGQSDIYLGDGSQWVAASDVSWGSENNPVEEVNANSLPRIADHIVGTGDDLKSIIEGASSGEVVVVGQGVHTVSGVVEIDVPISINGATANVTGKLSAAPDTNIDATDGAVIEQQIAGADVLKLTGEAQQVNLSDLILTWSSSIVDTDTGHGINSSPPNDPDGAFPAAGPFNCQWENITVVGNDGTSYGARLVNPQQNQIRGLYVDGGGGIEFVQESDETNYGNTTIEGFYCKLKNDDSSADQAHGISFHAKNRLLNLIYFARPQVNTSLESVTGQKHISINEDGGTIDTVAYIGLNMEDASGDNSAGMDLELGSYIVLPTRVGSNIPINGSLQMLTAGVMGSTDIRGDRINTDVFKAFENFTLHNPDGSDPRVVELSSGGDVQFRHTEATDNPYIQIYNGGRIGLINNAGGLAWAINGDEIEHRQTMSSEVVWESGTTAGRPGSPATAQRYFDTDLGQPIWYDGTDWVDAQGTTV